MLPYPKTLERIFIKNVFLSENITILEFFLYPKNLSITNLKYFKISINFLTKKIISSGFLTLTFGSCTLSHGEILKNGGKLKKDEYHKIIYNLIYQDNQNNEVNIKEEDTKNLLL